AGLPIRRASSCAAATASCDLSVSLLKSMCLSVFRDQVDRRLPRNEVPPVVLVHVVDRPAHLALHVVEPSAHAHELVLEAQHVLDLSPRQHVADDEPDGAHGDEDDGRDLHANSASRGFSRDTFCSSSSASRSFFVSFFGTVTRRRAIRSPLPPPFSFGAP